MFWVLYWLLDVRRPKPDQKFNGFQNYLGQVIIKMEGAGGGQNEGQRPKPDQNIHQI